LNVFALAALVAAAEHDNNVIIVLRQMNPVAVARNIASEFNLFFRIERKIFLEKVIHEINRIRRI
jgi:hypothetical protein